MIADSYLQLRNELEAAVTDLLKLAGQMLRTPQWLDMLQGFVSEIRQPLLVVVVGKSESGKSSLLNALCGADFVAEPDSDHICLFQYGRESKSADATATLREIYLPAAFLRDLKIVDTPGFEEILPQDRQTVIEFLSHADLVLLLFSLHKPWSRANWEFLTANQLPLAKFVFVLQHAGPPEPKEIAIIRRNLEDDAKQKLGFAPPIFAISARDAEVAPSNRSPQHQEQQSEFDALKEQINLVVTQSGGRVQQLRSACQLAQLVVYDIGSELRAQVDAVDHDEQRLARAEGVRHMQKGQVLRQVNDALHQLEGACREQAAEGVKAVHRKLSPATLLSRSRASLQDWERDCAAKLRASVEQQVNKAAEVLETELRGIWPRVHDTIDQQLVTGAKEKVPELGPDVAEQKRGLLDAVSRVLSQHLTTNLAAPTQLLTRVSIVFRAALIIAGLSVVAAAVTMKSNSGSAVALLLLAICGASAAGLFAWRGRKMILRAYAHAKDVRMRELRDATREQFERAIDRFDNAVFENLEPLIQYCALQRSSSEPVLARAEELQRTLVGLSSRLR